MIKEYIIVWRYPMQYGLNNEQLFLCNARTTEEAKTIFRQKEGYNRKKIMRVEEHPYKNRY